MAQDRGRKPSATKKQVRIQTPPPLSPDPEEPDISFGDPLIRRLSNEPRAGSPPPVLPVDGPPAAVALGGGLDPLNPTFGAEVAPQDPQVLANTRRNSEGGSMSPPTAPSADPPVALAAKVMNPFQKTLAHIEPRDSSDETAGGADDSSGATGRAGAKAFDVDAFTNMLKTGQGAPPRVEAQPAQSTNLDDLEDASSEEEDVALNKSHSSGSREAPPPPRHKYGKSIGGERAPQTVSFNDFEDDFQERKTSDSSDQSRRRMPPPPPAARRPAADAPPGPASPGQAPSMAKTNKAPPPPPARRGGSRANTISENASAEVGASDEVQDGAARRPLGMSHEASSRSSSISEYRGGSSTAAGQPPPPPPPTRRRRGSSKSSMENQAGASASASASRTGMPAGGAAAAGGNGGEAGRDGRDILADLSAFQAEVDALRSSYRSP